ncbi:hypothetical protein BY996DRAFT_8409095 [Phakopsora pachyrhizi]|nr:hypothetical protein BY996DRAFT_8409095 [Phakopsora pachyrhizi]
MLKEKGQVSTVLSYWPVTIPNWNCSKQFKILPLELTVKKNYFNVDEIKPDVYSAAKEKGWVQRDQSTVWGREVAGKCVRIQLKCVGCGQTILSLGEPNQSIRWFALPSEDWQGFIEYWICHDENDQHQSDGSGKIRDPKEYKGFIGDFDLRFDRAWIKSRHSERGWKFTRQESDGDCVEEDEVLNGERSEKGQEKIIPTILERGGGVDLKTRLECKSCLSELVNLIGQV